VHVETRDGLVVTGLRGIGDARSFVVGADAPTQQLERSRVRVLQCVPQTHAQVRLVGPLALWKRSRDERAHDAIGFQLTGAEELAEGPERGQCNRIVGGARGNGVRGESRDHVLRNGCYIESLAVDAPALEYAQFIV
jgi:hypothetical protein